MSDAPDPVPPPGKPKIGVLWIVVVVVLGLIFATLIYNATKSARGPHGPDTSPPATSTP